MITDTGKSILTKYMLGQTTSYASYIALGCGAKPISSTYNWTTDSSGYKAAFKAKTEMDFEMLRVPIISRGYADGQLVLTAELPTTEKYEISEIGLYPAVQNPSAGVADSRNLFTFSTTEKWYSQEGTASPQVELTTVLSALDEGSIVNAINFTDGVFTQASAAFRANSTNVLFANTERITRYELPRFFDSSIFVLGNGVAMASTVDTDAEVLAYSVQATDNFIILENTQADLTRNSPSDKIKVALSLINKDGTGTTNHPDRVNVIVDFIASNNGSYARFGKTENVSGYSSSNRYVVLSQTLGEMTITNSGSGFKWRNVNTIKIYVSVFDGGSLSTNHYVSLDAIRMENVSSPNPLYGLTGYTVIENTSSQTFVKENNTQALVEFRFSMDVV
jgi:hypothetical protein